MSHCSNGHNVLPTSPREVWPYMRDNAKPVTPLDAFFLMEARTYCPPSKAHKRRLLKLRPEITKARPPIEINAAPRLYHNDAAQMGRDARQCIQRAKLVVRALHEPVVITPEAPITRLPTQFVTQSRVKPEVDEWDMERINSNIARLAREAQQAREAADLVKG